MAKPATSRPTLPPVCISSPEWTHVSHASSVPLGYFTNGGDRMVIDGAPVPADPNVSNAGYNIVSPEYFRVMGIDLLRGRAFTEADKEHSTDVAVISESYGQKVLAQSRSHGSHLPHGKCERP